MSSSSPTLGVHLSQDFINKMNSEEDTNVAEQIWQSSCYYMELHDFDSNLTVQVKSQRSQSKMCGHRITN